MDKDTETTDNTTNRRTLLTSLGVAAVAGIAASSSSQAAQSKNKNFEPAHHAQDSWMNELTGSHRVFIDSATMPGGANAVRYANNILFTHEEDYDGSNEDYGLIVCFRHMSTPYGFNDAMWAKYGKYFSPRAETAPTTNPMNTKSPANGMNTLAGIAAKGVRFAICNKATQAFSQRLASVTNQTFEDVYAELRANPIPDSRFVPAGVIAVTRAQEYGYSLLYSES